MTATFFTLFIATTSAPMQLPPQRPVPSPTISPYLNLLRRGNSPAFNYLTLVQPQLQNQQNIANLQTQVSGLENTPQYGIYGGTGGELVTGKSVGYFTHRSYFLNNNGGPQQGRSLTGQQGGGSGNSVFQPGGGFVRDNGAGYRAPGNTQPQNNPQPNNIMPFNR